MNSYVHIITRETPRYASMTTFSEAEQGKRVMRTKEDAKQKQLPIRFMSSVVVVSACPYSVGKVIKKVV